MHANNDDPSKQGVEHVEQKPATNMAETSFLSDAARHQVEREKQLSFFGTLRIFWRSTLWVFYGQLVVFGYGIDGNIAGNLLAIPKFRQDYGQLFNDGTTDMYIISATWQSLYGGVSQLAAIVGAVATGWMADKIGRRMTNLLFCVISMVGVGVQFASTSSGSLPILTAGKAINGLSIGAWLVIGPLYASEVAPLKLRGWLTAITNIVQFSGTLLFTGVIYKLGPMNHANAYVLPFALQWAVPSIVILTVWFWPESPVWLVRMGRIDDAKASLRRLHGKGGQDEKGIDRDAILALIRDTVTREREMASETAGLSYAAAFSAENRQRTLICMFIYGCQYLSGLIFVLGYQSYYYQLAGFDAQFSFLLGMINNCSMFVANILSWPLLTVVGRRPLIVWGQLACAATLFIVGGASLPGERTSFIVTIAFMFAWVSWHSTLVSSFIFLANHVGFDLTGLYLSNHPRHGSLDCRCRNPILAIAVEDTRPLKPCPLPCAVAHRLHLSLHVQSRCRKSRRQSRIHFWGHDIPWFLGLLVLAARDQESYHHGAG